MWNAEKLQNIQISINPNRRFSASPNYSESMDELRRILQEKIASAIPDAKVTIGNTPAAIGPGLRIRPDSARLSNTSRVHRDLSGV